MNTFTVKPHTPAGDPRVQCVVTEMSDKYVVDQFIVLGDEDYANSVVRERQESAKHAPLRYPPNGVI